MQCGDLPQCDDAALFFCSLWIISHWISCRIGISAVAVALGGRWGIVPDRAASGAITEQAPDCSLLPSSSLSYLFPCLPFIARGPAAYKCSHILFHIQTVYPLLTSPYLSLRKINSETQYWFFFFLFYPELLLFACQVSCRFVSNPTLTLPEDFCMKRHSQKEECQPKECHL